MSKRPEKAVYQLSRQLPQLAESTQQEQLAGVLRSGNLSVVAVLTVAISIWQKAQDNAEMHPAHTTEAARTYDAGMAAGLDEFLTEIWEASKGTTRED